MKFVSGQGKEAILEEYYSSIITEGVIYVKNLDDEHKNNFQPKR